MNSQELQYLSEHFSRAFESKLTQRSMRPIMTKLLWIFFLPALAIFPIIPFSFVNRPVDIQRLRKLPEKVKLGKTYSYPWNNDRGPGNHSICNFSSTGLSNLGGLTRDLSPCPPSPSPHWFHSICNFSRPGLSNLGGLTRYLRPCSPSLSPHIDLHSLKLQYWWQKQIPYGKWNSNNKIFFNFYFTKVKNLI